MGTFADIMKHIRSEEGGISNLVGDNGGYTYIGIAQNYWGKKYKSLFDKLKTDLDQKKKPAADVELQKMVDNFYYKEFWLPIGGDKIPFIVAKTILNDGINSGIPGAIKRCETNCGLPQTGKLSQKLIDLINNMSES
jgi:lysozyme family protein